MLILHYRNHIVRWLSHHLHVDLFPAAIYLLKEIPAKTSFEDVARIAVMVIVFCTLASIIPAARAAMLNPVEAIRRE